MSLQHSRQISEIAATDGVASADNVMVDYFEAWPIAEVQTEKTSTASAKAVSELMASTLHLPSDSGDAPKLGSHFGRQVWR